MKRRRTANSSTRSASFDRLPRYAKAWLLDDYGMLQHGDAMGYMLGLEKDFQRWWRLHKPGEPFRDPYKWWLQREKEHETEGAKSA